jgi:hypothetical protein
VIQIVVATPFAAFMASFGSEAGKDAYAVFKDWVKELWRAREESNSEHGAIDVMDSDRTHVILSSKIPETRSPR